MDIESMNAWENATFNCVYKMITDLNVTLIQIDVISIREDVN